MFRSEDNISIPKIQYKHAYALPFESTIDHTVLLHFSQTYWYHTFITAFIYIVAINWLAYWMKSKLDYQLNSILVLWNSFLALFSILGTIRVGEEFLYSIFGGSFYQSFCYTPQLNTAVVDWAFLFGLSKIVELGDTVFLVLKKRPITFLHVYHHCTVLVYTWSTGSKRAAIARWFVTLNLMAHSAMYTYYALMSAGIKVPRKIARCVTIVQITQFVIGLFILFTVCAIKAITDWNCYNEWTTLFFGIFIYFSYFVLFGNFFIETYHKKFTRKYIKQN